MENIKQEPAKILFVDDEPNILSSLRRLFRNQGYHIQTAESGADGIKALEAEPFDLVISDMRMPEMDGVRFLEHVRSLYPNTVRILLTGYSDIQSIQEAINRGEIYRYITKPWDDNDITLLVKHALERHALEREKRRLEELTQKQNDELKALNASLEVKVEERTRELRRAAESLVAMNGKLKASFITSIKVFSSVIEMRGGNLAGHSLRVADLSRKMAMKMGLDARATQEVFVAALLHNIGKVGFSDDLLALAVNQMNGDNLGLYRKHPLRAEQLLMPLEDLRGSAGIIRAQLECFNGEGFPDGQSGFNIPTGARILALASDYYNYQNGTLLQRRLRPEEARDVIMHGIGKRYDPQVVKAFSDVMSGVEETAQENGLQSWQLQPGMTVTRDVIAKDGFLLLSADHVLDERLIEQIQEFEKAMNVRLTYYIRIDRRT
ncbi:MAG: response regulator [Burkholderiales bacterium]|nr:response regulator [Burkholderiales bacterium]